MRCINSLLLVSILSILFISCESILSPEADSFNMQLHNSSSGLTETHAMINSLEQSQNQPEWHLQENDVSVPLLSVHFVDADNGWTAGLRSSRLGPATLQHTANGGETWRQQQIDTPLTLRDVYFRDYMTGWVLRDSVAILHTADGGETWQQQYSGSGNLHDIHFVNLPGDSHGWAVGENGSILHTSDDGQNWSEQESGTESPLYTVHFADTYTGWTTGFDGVIRHTKDGGNSWEEQMSLTAPLRSIYFVDNQTGWTVGYEGTILHTKNGGETWYPQESRTENRLNSVHFVDAQTGWAVGGDTNVSTILYTTDGGETWLSQESGTESILFSVFFLDAHTGWAVGNHGTILKYRATDSGFENPMLVESPEQGINLLIRRLNELQAKRVLNNGKAKSLEALLDAASRHISRGHTTPACNQLGAFIRHVETLRYNGTLNEERADELITLAESTLGTMT